MCACEHEAAGGPLACQSCEDGETAAQACRKMIIIWVSGCVNQRFQPEVREGDKSGMGMSINAKFGLSSIVVYQPTILRSMAEICEALGVGPKTVKKWIEKGAPIAVEGEGRNVRYSAESGSLQMWRVTGKSM